MESTGFPGKIQVSHTTASLLTAAGKTSWLKPREDAVQAKGKGVLNTFWLRPTAALQDHGSFHSGQSDNSETASTEKVEENSDRLSEMASASQARLVGWMTETLMEQLKKIVRMFLSGFDFGVSFDSTPYFFPVLRL